MSAGSASVADLLPALESLRSALDDVDYLADEGTVMALFCASRLGQPVLIEGEPGVGKTEAAKALAAALQTPLVRLQCYEGIDVAEALYAPQALNKLVRGELDWIVMKALEKDRTRRYVTASAFAQDVQRHLQDEPVEAAAPSMLYKFQKFARRHKVALVTATTMAALLLAAAIISVLLAIKATDL